MKDKSVFVEFDPHDGYRAEYVRGGSSASVSVGGWQGGERVNLDPRNRPEAGTIEIKEWPEASTTDVGAALRLHLLADAMCRYFTTGGNKAEFLEAVDAVCRFIPEGLRFPGYHLSDTFSTTEGTFQHIFCNDTDEDDNWVWVEDTFIEPKTMEELLREQAEEDGPDSGLDHLQGPAGPLRPQLPG